MFEIIPFFDAIKDLFFLVGYVSNYNIFPEPLTTEEEKIYLEKYESGDENAKKVLIERNLRLVAHIAKKYVNSTNEQEDIISIGTIGLIKAVSSYNSKKGVRLRHICFKMYRKWDSSILETLNLKNNTNIKSEMRSSFPQYIKSSQLKALKLEECNSIGRQIAYYRVNQDMTMQMLADKCELSKSVIEKAEFEDCVTLENIEKIEKALNIRGKLYREPYYLFLLDNPVEKIEKFVKDKKMMWKDFEKLTNIDRHTINSWRYRSKVIAKRSFEKLQIAGVV